MFKVGVVCVCDSDSRVYDVTSKGVKSLGCSECCSDNWPALFIKHLIEVDALLSHTILSRWCGREAAKHALSDDKDQ